MAKNLSKYPRREWNSSSISISLDELDGKSIEEICRLFKDHGKHLKSPTVRLVSYGYDGGADLEVNGYVRKTQQEIEKFDAQNKARQIAARQESKKQREIAKKNDLKTLEKLKKKYPEHFQIGL